MKSIVGFSLKIAKSDNFLKVGAEVAIFGTVW